ncbi:hypothetical protein ACFU5O_29415 [Streptomyces sp. NPDC057445]|uniref:hypothetical protein n=1 Tax=Streptomyces sp. NPDC057445 TaxID=3346136 RepID=UPI0036B5A3FB
MAGRERQRDVALHTELREVGGLLALSVNRAGPFYIRPGTTLLPGAAGTVSADLNPRLPDGPWKATLKLESGRVKQQTSATLTFPPNGSTWTTDLGSITGPATWCVGGGALLAATGVGAFILKRRRTARSKA